MDWQLPNLSQNLWIKYGLKGNPFDTSPLSQEGNAFLPLSEAIVGRGLDTKESRILTNILSNPGGARIVVEGNLGVGKTTFINYHRYLWEIHAQDRLFTTKREIAITEEWRLRHFLINILCAIITKIIDVIGKKRAIENPIFKELEAMSKIIFQNSFNIEGSIMGCGGGFGSSQQVNIPIIPETQLIEYFRKVVQEIKKIGYAGVFLHIDNLELFHTTNMEKAKIFFEEIRDSIQIPDVYFIFVCRKGFFQEVINPSRRVRSIFFGRTITIPPLSKEQVLNVIRKRYQLLTLKGQQITIPIENKFIEYLYDLYEGKLRYIMDAMNMILPEFNYSFPYTITKKEAQECLSYLVEENIRENLTATEWKILSFCVKLENFTNKLISTQFSFSPPNVTRIIQRLVELDLVFLEKKEGRNSHYRVNEYIRIINKARSIIQTKEKKDKNKKKLPKNSTAARLDEAVKAIHKKQKITHKEYTKLFNISASTATRDLKKLVQNGSIIALGKGRSKYYKVASA